MLAHLLLEEFTEFVIAAIEECFDLLGIYGGEFAVVRESLDRAWLRAKLISDKR